MPCRKCPAIPLCCLFILAVLCVPGAAGRLLLAAEVVTVPELSPTATAPCSNAESPSKTVSGTEFMAELNGTNNINPNSTGIPAPLNIPARGIYKLTVDESGQQASWTLQLCDVPEYIAAHLHSGSPIADYAPPLIPLEPYVIPSNPFAPSTLLPRLCPPVNITGCSYTKSGSFVAADIFPLAGRDAQTPKVTNFQEFVSALNDGNIYINIHSLIQPANIIRGNLVKADGGTDSTNTDSSTSSSSGGCGGSSTTATPSPATEPPSASPVAPASG